MTSESMIKHLQKGLAMELTAAHQYQLHAAVLSDWGIEQLASKMREEMGEELGHSDTFLQRILFLKGIPKLELDKPPKVATSLKAMFADDLEDEKNAIAFYSSAAKLALESGDIGTRTLFEKIVLDEEGHMAWLELQLDLIDRIGEAAYVAKHL